MMRNERREHGEEVARDDQLGCPRMCRTGRNMAEPTLHCIVCIDDMTPSSLSSPVHPPRAPRSDWLIRSDGRDVVQVTIVDQVLTLRSTDA